MRFEIVITICGFLVVWSFSEDLRGIEKAKLWGVSLPWINSNKGKSSIPNENFSLSRKAFDKSSMPSTELLLLDNDISISTLPIESSFDKPSSAVHSNLEQKLIALPRLNVRNLKGKRKTKTKKAKLVKKIRSKTKTNRVKSKKVFYHMTSTPSCTEEMKESMIPTMQTASGIIPNKMRLTAIHWTNGFPDLWALMPQKKYTYGKMDGFGILPIPPFHQEVSGAFIIPRPPTQFPPKLHNQPLSFENILSFLLHDMQKNTETKLENKGGLKIGSLLKKEGGKEPFFPFQKKILGNGNNNKKKKKVKIKFFSTTTDSAQEKEDETNKLSSIIDSILDKVITGNKEEEDASRLMVDFDFTKIISQHNSTNNPTSEKTYNSSLFHPTSRSTDAGITSSEINDPIINKTLSKIMEIFSTLRSPSKSQEMTECTIKKYKSQTTSLPTVLKSYLNEHTGGTNINRVTINPRMCLLPNFVYNMPQSRKNTTGTYFTSNRNKIQPEFFQNRTQVALPVWSDIIDEVCRLIDKMANSEAELQRSKQDIIDDLCKDFYGIEHMLKNVINKNINQEKTS